MKSVILAAAGLCLVSGAANAQSTIYTTDFTSGTGAFTGSGVAAVTASGEHYLELYNSNAATLTLNTANYTGLTATFNLYGIESVDGNGPYGGAADPFLIYINGALAYNINVANYAGNTQSYNGNLAQSGPGYSYAPQTGATAIGKLGYGSGGFGDSTYLVSFALPDAATTVITLVGATNEAPSHADGTTGGNEAYGVDNFTLAGTPIAVVGGVPEPATWAMMLVGFGAAGVGLRRRARVVARVACTG